MVIATLVTFLAYLFIGHLIFRIWVFASPVKHGSFGNCSDHIYHNKWYVPALLNKNKITASRGKLLRGVAVEEVFGMCLLGWPLVMLVFSAYGVYKSITGISSVLINNVTRKAIASTTISDPTMIEAQQEVDKICKEVLS